MPMSEIQRLIMLQKEKRRLKKMEPKIFFQFLFAKSNYTRIEEADESIENMFLLMSNRKQSNIFLISSNQFRIVNAMDLGFCAIPIIKFQSFMQNDYQLNLIESYLLKLKYFNDQKFKN